MLLLYFEPLKRGFMELEDSQGRSLHEVVQCNVMRKASSTCIDKNSKEGPLVKGRCLHYNRAAIKNVVASQTALFLGPLAEPQ